MRPRPIAVRKLLPMRKQVFEGNVRNVYPRLDAQLKSKGK